MATTVKRLTYDDLEAIPRERPGDRHEIINGELVVTPSPAPMHQIVSRDLFRLIDRHVRTSALGEVLYAPVDIRLTPDNVLIPDIIYIARDRLHIIGPKTIDGPPDLVVEILSPGTRRRDLDTKRELYARFGVQEYWLVDPDARTVTVLALAGNKFEPFSSGEAGTIRSRVLQGLTLTVNDVFAEVER
jgi:Uma2 family endonuclease